MTDIDNRTYYELLGIEPTASVEEIKEAYREIARIFHPDSNFYSDIIDDAVPEDSAVFKSINQAYQTLVNEDKRRVYDASLLTGPAGWGDEENLRTAPAGESTFDAEVEPAPVRDAGPIPEEWVKEREYFEENYAEIFKPAPRVNLTGDSGAESLDGPVSILGWEEEEAAAALKRFGNLTDETEIPEPATLPISRREVMVDTFDPVNLIVYLGMPIMFVIVVVEIILYM